MDQWPVRILVYGAGEAIDGVDALAGDIKQQLTRLEQVCSNQVVAATAQLDASDLATTRFVLDPFHSQPVLSLPNVNVGDPAQLVDFVKWSAATCPAQRTILVLSGHGAAWEDGQVEQVLGTMGPAATRSRTAVPKVPGAIHHARLLFGLGANPVDAITRAVLIDGQARDFLSNAELGSACSRISTLIGAPIDVMVFDACLMSSVEILQELHESVATVVGSIDELSSAGIDMAGPARAITQAGGQFDAVGLARTIAGAFRPSAPFDSCVAVSLQSGDWNNAVLSFQRFSHALLAWINASEQNAAACRMALAVASVSVVKFTDGNLADISALTRAFSTSLPASILADLRSAEASFRACIAGSTKGNDYREAVGISIFSPTSISGYVANRPDYMRLQFPSITGWNLVLDALYPTSDATRFFNPQMARLSVATNDVEFSVDLLGLPFDAISKARLERIVRQTVLGKLAEGDLLQGVSVVPLMNGQPGTLPPGSPSIGFAVVKQNGAPPMTTLPAPVIVTHDMDAAPTSAGPTSSPDGLQIRVTIRGVPLDDTTKKLIDTELRSAVMRELATTDNQGTRKLSILDPDAKTRSLLESANLPWKVGGGTTLGLVALPMDLMK